MKLRNGKIYNPFENSCVTTKKFTGNCLICSLDYKKGDHITSCSTRNISLHSFHINCLSIIKKYNYNKLFKCPYCNKIITIPLKKFSFI